MLFFISCEITICSLLLGNSKFKGPYLLNIGDHKEVRVGRLATAYIIVVRPRQVVFNHASHATFPQSYNYYRMVGKFRGVKFLHFSWFIE